MGKGFTVVTAELRTHGGSLDRVADRVAEAGEKGGSFEFGIDTFGVIGQVFSGEARRVTAEATREIADYANDIRDLAKSVRAAADQYDQAEDKHEKPFRTGGN
ncbi:type VII secretion target [Amycolatopsis aidingensis]|uniref:type VII secretion target n=1 Tax=Amycolatopsis aidingensis TaxID=2842453 RepID=UPI001C0DDF58|nr:type VII secretion target [Amycolatopsis aidingensis]